jgi:hypothetical protein
MKSSPIKLKQKLSPYAAKKKAARDLAFAKSPARQYKKAQNQRLDRAEGTVGDGMDRHHTESGDVRKVSIKDNRGNFGNGTKNEKTKNMSKPFKMKGFPTHTGVSPAKQTTDPKKSKIDKMIEMEKKTDYSNWEGSDAQKASKGRSSIQEHQLTLKELAKQKEKK